MFSIGPLGRNLSEILIEIYILSCNKMPLKMSSGNWRPFCFGLNVLTLWGRVTHMRVSKLIIIGSDNGLSPSHRQAIIWNNDGILLNGPSRTNLNDISIEIYAFSFKKIHLKMASAKWRPFCLGLNVLSPLKQKPRGFDEMAIFSSLATLKLSKWQLLLQPVAKISSKWQHFRFSVIETRLKIGHQ